MLPPATDLSGPSGLTTVPNQDAETHRSRKRHFSDLDPGDLQDQTPLTRRTCRSAVSDQAAQRSPANREELGGKGMFLQRMKSAGLPVPPFQCVTVRVMNALEQQPLDSHLSGHYLPGIDRELDAETSLKNIREYLSVMPPSEQTKRNNWLAGLAKFVASDDYYQQVKNSEAAQKIRGLGTELNRLTRSQPVIVRSSGIDEDNYGDAQAGKYLSLVQEEEDILRTCFKVMASAYRPEVCAEAIPQPMALIIQQCIDCQYGGVAMSFQSFQDNTVRVEYTKGQPRGVVAGQSGNTPHRIDIYRGGLKEEADSYQYFPGTISSHFILHRNKDNNGYLETRIDDANPQSNVAGHSLTDDMVSKLREAVTELENLLLCPVDVEFAVDHQGQLFLLQVRPVTRLSGDMDFAMPIPEKTLAIGDSVSEGYCTGTLWLAKNQPVDSMPEGAIVLAPQAEDWMLEREFLKRAGGLVFARGGFNDHIAILMKQERKTLMLAGDQFAAVAAQVGQQVTLACARFNGEPGAFIVAGDLTGRLVSHRSLSSAVSDVPLAKAVPSWDDLSLPEGTFSQVASGFQWLSNQNARLLAFFATGGGLDCLANPVKMSMSPQRINLFAETRDSVNRLVYGAEALLNGYQAFLRLAENSDSTQLQLLQEELPQLIDRFRTLKQIIGSVLESIILPQQSDEEGQLSARTFRQWVADCHQLKCSLQALNPGEAVQVRSVHDLIFALHKRFVEALAPVTLASGQGRISWKKDITYVDCSTSGGSDQETPLLSRSCKAALKKSQRPAIVIIMDDALIINLKLGYHVGLIELLENAEGGKGRTLRLKFSDQFDRADDRYAPGKLKRMWFLAHLLKVIELDKHAGSMKLSCNAIAGEMIVECPRMESRQIMQNAFVKLVTALRLIKNLDVDLKRIAIFEGDQWSFQLLAQCLDSDVSAEANRFAFQHCLFVMVYGIGDFIIRDCLRLLKRLLGKKHKKFIHYARRLDQSKNNRWDILMSDNMAEDIRRELLQHCLLLDPNKATPLIEDVYSLGGQYFVVNPSFSYSLSFEVPPGQSLGDQKEKMKTVLRKQGLKYASQRVRNDKDLVLATIAVHPYNLDYVSEELKSDKEVILSCFQALNLLKTEEARSVNRLIFDLHEYFSKTRAPVSLASAQGMLSRDGHFIYVDCTTPGGPGEKAAVLSPSCRESLRGLRLSNGTVICKDDNLIVNLDLEDPVGLIELLENAEGGKGCTLRLKFAEKFYDADGSDAPGKLKRMWFLAQLLKAIELDKHADSMKLSCSAIAGELIVEYSRLTSRKIMQDAFVKLIIALDSIYELDEFLEGRTIFEDDQWSFDLLAQRLDSDVSAEANRFFFQHCLFLMVDSNRSGINPGCYPLLSNHQQRFIDHSRRLVNSKDNLREVLMSDKNAEGIGREPLHHFLLLHPAKAMGWVDLVYPDLKGQYYVIKPSYAYSLEFDLPPVQSPWDHEEKIRSVMLRGGLKYASQGIRNDKHLVLAAISLDPYNLVYLSEELKSDKEVVLAAVTRDGYQLRYASPKPQDNEEVVMAAIKNYPAALRYASERIRSDKSIIKTLMVININILGYVNKTLLKDPDYMLDLIEQDSDVFNFVAFELEDNQDFVEAAIQRNSEVLQYIS
ncbi:DUF4116 domain-containing protein [Endozoicomonas sp. 8E]|uniref:DUF4116 domain-containing protein n=1 Tax=Endozoicomonas sp. 8E TaxID=3035692 RepID=UPI002938EC42|nr:DUF4116 domain-containing protein [Endozoicomonas sp. 8E]WOG25644.1 DUF4116 domain-containing protein [Endozoicomonas sp. 8E]